MGRRFDAGRQRPPLPDLTRAEIDATIYQQSWRSVEAPASRTEFSVLALDADHAIEVGRARLIAMYRVPSISGVFELVESKPRPDWDAEIILGLMLAETTAARDERRRRHASEAA